MAGSPPHQRWKSRPSGVCIRVRTKSAAARAASRYSGSSRTQAARASAAIIRPFQSARILSSRWGRTPSRTGGQETETHLLQAPPELLPGNPMPFGDIRLRIGQMEDVQCPSAPRHGIDKIPLLLDPENLRRESGPPPDRGDGGSPPSPRGRNVPPPPRCRRPRRRKIPLPGACRSRSTYSRTSLRGSGVLRVAARLEGLHSRPERRGPGRRASSRSGGRATGGPCCIGGNRSRADRRSRPGASPEGSFPPSGSPPPRRSAPRTGAGRAVDGASETSGPSRIRRTPHRTAPEAPQRRRRGSPPGRLPLLRTGGLHADGYRLGRRLFDPSALGPPESADLRDQLR